jgi:hypothetical protein
LNESGRKRDNNSASAEFSYPPQAFLSNSKETGVSPTLVLAIVMHFQFQPMPLLRRVAAFDDPEWIFELKYDASVHSPLSKMDVLS